MGQKEVMDMSTEKKAKVKKYDPEKEYEVEITVKGKTKTKKVSGTIYAAMVGGELIKPTEFEPGIKWAHPAEVPKRTPYDSLTWKKSRTGALYGNLLKARGRIIGDENTLKTEELPHERTKGPKEKGEYIATILGKDIAWGVKRNFLTGKNIGEINYTLPEGPYAMIEAKFLDTEQRIYRRDPEGWYWIARRRPQGARKTRPQWEVLL
jgi:hypothetical protein